MWKEILADIESRVEAENREEAMIETGELRRGEESVTTLADRLYAHVGRDVTLIIAG